MDCCKWFISLVIIGASADNGYDDSLARHILAPLSSAAYAADPSTCLNNTLPGAQLSSRFEVPCDCTGNNTCSAFTFVDESRGMIGLVFRGTVSSAQFETELPSMLADQPIDFQNGGKVVPYFNDAFYSLWNNGSLEENVKNLTGEYPDYDFYATGHSLGGSLAAIAAAQIITSGVLPSEKVFLYTFGAPRVGDAQMMQSLNNTDRVFRVVHNKDMAVHLPFQSMGLQHHGVQIFYENDMQPGESYVICESEEDEKCANKFSVIDSNLGMDHVHYFGINFHQYGWQGCITTAASSN